MFLETLIDARRPGFLRMLMIDAMRECREWAADLLPSYRKAMCLASFEAMTKEEQKSFVVFIAGASHG